MADLKGASINNVVYQLVDTNGRSMIAPSYNASSTYNNGDYCVYSNTLFKCSSQSSTTGTFDQSKWEPVTLVDEIKLAGNDNILDLSILYTEDMNLSDEEKSQALENIGAANSEHTHTTSDITGTLPISKGGTGSTTKEGAIANLGITASAIDAAPYEHQHSVEDLTGVLPVANGGTGFDNLDDLRDALGVGSGGGGSGDEPSGTQHDLGGSTIIGILPVSKGGTGSNIAATARANLGITPENIGASPNDHTHIPSDIEGATPINKGGTGATTASAALTNLGAAAAGHTHTPSSIGAASESHTHTLNNITGVQNNTLPVSMGGTGATTIQGLKDSLSLGDIQTSISNHISNGTVHVTQADKTKWNNQIFIAEYNTTTLDEISDAYAAGYMIYAHKTSSTNSHEGVLYYLCDTWFDTDGAMTEALFISMPEISSVNQSNQIKFEYVFIEKGDPWEHGYTIVPATGAYVPNKYNTSDSGKALVINSSGYVEPTDMSGIFVPKVQGSSNSGKYLSVGSDGNVTPVTLPVNIIKAGDVINLANAPYSINGFLTGSSQSAYMSISFGCPITATNISVNGYLCIRGVKGYLNDMTTSGVNVNSSGYTTNATILNAQYGIIGLTVTKSTAFSNSTNNTPVAAMVGSGQTFTLTFS